MQSKLNWLLLACAAAALVYAGYRQLGGTPQPRAVSAAACTPQAIQAIANITERAIHSAHCAQRGK